MCRLGLFEFDMTSQEYIWLAFWKRFGLFFIIRHCFSCSEPELFWMPLLSLTVQSSCYHFWRVAVFLLNMLYISDKDIGQGSKFWETLNLIQHWWQMSGVSYRYRIVFWEHVRWINSITAGLLGEDCNEFLRYFGKHSSADFSAV